MLHLQVWVEVDTQIANDPTWRSVFQTAAEREAKASGKVLTELQTGEGSEPGKTLLFWELVKE